MKKTWTTEDTIIGIGNYAPKYIFLTECSSIGGGYVIKEALRAAYPDQPQPKFFRVDPRQVICLLEHSKKIMHGEEMSSEEYRDKKRELEEFFEKRIWDKSARILVYDADWCSGKSPGSIVSLLKNPEAFGFSSSIRCYDVKMNLPWSLEKKVDYRPTNADLILDISEEDIIEILPTPTIYSEVTDKGKWRGNRGPYNFRARICKGRLSYVKQLKAHGKKVGEKLKGGK